MTYTGTLDTSYNRTVGEALDATFAAAQAAGARRLNLSTDRLIILSDQHKGARNGADDFRSVEPLYNAVLRDYFDRDYALVGLGDCEELWEERPRAVIQAYGPTLALTRRFNDAGRYLRVWGNHDDEWRHRHSVERHLIPVYGDPQFLVPDALLYDVFDQGARLGTLFLVHGHQGTLDSDRFAWFSRLVVRYIWRPIQRLTNWRPTTPATSWELRKKHNVALYAWSALQRGTVLIAGHTHRPVFEARVSRFVVERELDAVLQQPLSRRSLKRQAELTAELAWMSAQDQQLVAGSAASLKPSYFNSGCCVYRDNTMTGVEIAEGEIRLVHWALRDGEGVRTVLAATTVRAVFDAL